MLASQHYNVLYEKRIFILINIKLLALKITFK